VSKKAVVRNRIKRRIFHVLKDRIFDLDRTYDIVVVVLPPAGDLGFDTLKKSLDENLSKLRVF
jgi:ribonuclease P protein component